MSTSPTKRRDAALRAADIGQSELVQLLLQSGTDANALDQKGSRTSHFAVPTDPQPKKKFGLGQITQVLDGGLNLMTGGGFGVVSSDYHVQ